jgi:hypothetical protein
MAYKKTIIQKALESSSWKEYKGRDELPSSADQLIKKWDIFKGGNGWWRAYYLGVSPENATKWIIVTPDGGYYKVFARYMVWYEEGNTARWTDKSLKNALVALFNGQKPPMDPDYQT